MVWDWMNELCKETVHLPFNGLVITAVGRKTFLMLLSGFTVAHAAMVATIHMLTNRD